MTVLAVVVIAIIALIIYHFATISKSEDYIPKNFSAYAEVDSISEVYQSLINLRAAEFILANDSVEAFSSIYNDIKGSQLINSPVGKWVLGMGANLIVLEDYTPVMIVDAKLKSILTRVFPFYSSFLNIKDLDIKKLSGYDFVIYEILTKKSSFYISFKNNLIFISTKIRGISQIYRSNEEASTISGFDLEKDNSAFINLYADSNNLLNAINSSKNIVKSLKEDFDFSENTILSLDINNQEFYLKGKSKFKTENSYLQSIINFKPAFHDSINYIPKDINFFNSIKFQDFEDLFKLFLDLNNRDIEKSYNSINSASQLIFSLNIEELLFDWIGNEIGIYNIAGSVDPVIFIKIKDFRKYISALEKMDASITMDIDSSLVIDDIRMKKIVVPSFINWIVEMFVSGFDTPYYIESNSYALFSMSPEVLSYAVREIENRNVITKDDNFKRLNREIDKNANIKFYYDLNNKLPDFLKQDNLLSDLLTLYESGFGSINVYDGNIKFKVAANGENKKERKLYPAYPKIVRNGISSNVVVENISGGASSEFIYIDSKDNICILNSGNSIISSPIAPNSRFIVIDDDIVTFSSSGVLWWFDSKLKAYPNFPLSIDSSFIFNPAIYKDSIITYSRKEKRLLKISKNGSVESIDFEPKGHIFTKPLVIGNNLAVFPKKLSGEFYIINAKNGSVYSGWPVLAGGICLSEAVSTNILDETYIFLLTQNGILNCWDFFGNSVNGFPIKVAGDFYTKAIIIEENKNSSKQKSILTLNTDGILTKFNINGKEILSKKIPEVADKSSRIKLFDINKDGNEEIFIYGDYDYIIGLDSQFQAIKNFPITGTKEPSFADLNFDGNYEIITAGMDKKLYAYYIGEKK